MSHRFLSIPPLPFCCLLGPPPWSGSTRHQPWRRTRARPWTEHSAGASVDAAGPGPEGGRRGRRPHDRRPCPIQRRPPAIRVVELDLTRPVADHANDTDRSRRGHRCPFGRAGCLRPLGPPAADDDTVSGRVERAFTRLRISTTAAAVGGSECRRTTLSGSTPPGGRPRPARERRV